GALGGRNVAAWQPDSSAEAACRHVDQHQVQRPLAEQVLRHRRLPARQGDLATVTGAHARAFDLDLAAVEANFSLSLPPAVPRLAFGTAVTGPAQPGRVSSIMLARVAMPAVRQKRSKLAPTSCQASSMVATGTTAADVVGSFMALLSFV